MSPTVRAGLIFGAGAIVALIGSTLLPIPCLGFLSVLALGMGAGYTANKVMNSARDRRIGRGATAGAIGGVLALVGTVIAVLIALNLPGTQAAIQEQLAANPDLGDAGIDPAQLTSLISGAGGIVGGFCGGLINLVVMVVGGLLGSLFWKGAALTADYVPAGGSAAYNQPPTGGYIPPSGGAQQYTTPPAGTTPGGQEPEGGARVYDPNDPNRPPSQ